MNDEEIFLTALRQIPLSVLFPSVAVHADDIQPGRIVERPGYRIIHCDTDTSGMYVG